MSMYPDLPKSSEEPKLSFSELVQGACDELREWKLTLLKTPEYLKELQAKGITLEEVPTSPITAVIFEIGRAYTITHAGSPDRSREGLSVEIRTQNDKKEVTFKQHVGIRTQADTASPIGWEVTYDEIDLLTRKNSDLTNNQSALNKIREARTILKSRS